ncbi:MAG: Smr/MutS family protein [Bryobacter sp.]|nr:Smr/MutS family protein [Bryobacter sp.]
MIEYPITDTLDLHQFHPRDAKSALEAWLEEVHARGFTRVRIIHGKGIGVQREMARAVLARTPFVVRFRDAESWGATVAELKEAGTD